MGEYKRKFKSHYIDPLEAPPRKIGTIIAFDIETEQIELNKKISTYNVKQKSILLFGTACLYHYPSKKGENWNISSEYGFLENVEGYLLQDEFLFFEKKSFTEWLLSAVSKYKKVIVYAHNITFDIREAIDLPLMSENGFSISVFNPASKQFVLKFVKHSIATGRKQTLTLTDTLNLYPAPLKDVGNTIGLPKLDEELELDRAKLKEAMDSGKWEDVLKYNVRDTQIVANAVIVREKVVNKLGGELKLTNPSTAMDVYRRRFQKVSIKKPSRQYLQFIRKAYYGGRTEVFFRGIVTTPEYRENAEVLYQLKSQKYKDYGFLIVDSIAYLDVNSEYPTSMYYFPTPVKEIAMMEGKEARYTIQKLYDLGLIIPFDVLNPLKSIYKAWKKQIKWLKKQIKNIDWNWVKEELKKRKGTDELLELRKYFANPILYITEATVYVTPEHVSNSLPPLPVRKDTEKIVFPMGYITGCWAQYELDILNPPKNTTIVKVHRVLFFKGDWLFTEYIKTFYSLKAESKKKNDKVMYLVAKLFMNSLYGKWAERKRVSKMLTREELNELIMEHIQKTGNYAVELTSTLDYGTLRVDGEIINIIGSYMEVKTREFLEPYSAGISVFITSAARAIIREYMTKAIEGGGYVFYCDTDSLITTQQGKKALKKFIDPIKLGYLDEELTSIAFVEINTLKDYKVFMRVDTAPSSDPENIAYIKKFTIKIDETNTKAEYYYIDKDNTFKVKYKLKGVPLNKAKAKTKYDDSAFAVERLIGIKEFLKYGKFGLYWVEQIKEVSRKYDKAASANGWVQPFEFNDIP